MPFVTVSDVLNRLNSEIQQSLHQSAPESSSSTLWKSGGRFELQTREADGSARPATREEIDSVDCSTMVQQAAALVQEMATDAEKLAWARAQRMAGNQLYASRQYQAALDVYLTCLVVAAAPANDDSSRNESTVAMETTARWLLFGQVLNNLALCTMQLGWYQKTIHFCTIALEQYHDHCHVKSTVTNDSKVAAVDRNAIALLAFQQSKLHYQRAKAYRLRGDYALARPDLRHATQRLDEYNAFCSVDGGENGAPHDDSHGAPVNGAKDGPLGNGNSTSATISLESWTNPQSPNDGTLSSSVEYDRCQRAIQREQELLDRAMARAVQNRQRQRHALQQCYSIQRSLDDNATSAPNSPCVPDSAPERSGGPRAYSTIRAPSHSTRFIASTNDDEDGSIRLAVARYWQWYWDCIAYQAQRLVDWIDERERARVDKID
jgi:tetratricopeptide (TPR) repeat protein